MSWKDTYQFADAWVLWFLLIIPILWFLYFWKGQKLTTSFAANFSKKGNKIQESGSKIVKPAQFVTRTFALCLFIMALARPQISKDSPT
jgi:hypothetical protein